MKWKFMSPILFNPQATTPGQSYPFKTYYALMILFKLKINTDGVGDCLSNCRDSN